MYNKYLIIPLFSAVVFYSFSLGQDGKKIIVAGKVVNQKNIPLKGVNIIVESQQIGTTTDKAGNYRLVAINTANFRITYKYIGYRPVQRKINFEQCNKRIINIKMEPIVIPMQSVEISEKKFVPDIGTYELKVPELRRIPAFYSDAISAVKTLPGVGSNNELSRSFHVHGGNADDNLILLEGISISQPRKIRNSYQEGMSLINPALLDHFQLITGAFPARYGGKLYSVLYSEYRRHTNKRFRGKFELSLINASLMLEGTISNSGYWAIAGRWTDTKFILNTLQKTGDVNPKFYDIQAIGRLKLSSKHKLHLIGLYLNNDFQFTPENFKGQYGCGDLAHYNEFKTEFSGKEQALFRTKLFSIILESQFFNQLKMKNYFIISRNKEYDKVNLRGDTYQRMNVEYGTDIAETTDFFSTQFELRDNILHENKVAYKNEITITIPAHVIRIGGSINQHQFSDHLKERYSFYVKSYQDTIIESKEESYFFTNSAQLTHNSYSLFCQDNWQISSKFSAKYGLRFYSANHNRLHSLCPRLRFKWIFEPKTWISIALGKHSQPPEYREYRNSDHQLLTNVPIQKAVKAVLGFYHQNVNETVFQTEFYYIKIKPCIPYKIEDIFIHYQPEYEASGKTYGLTFYWYGKFNKRLNSWLSYHYMVARQKIPGLGTGNFRSPTDQRHSIAIFFQDDIPEIPTMQAYTRFLFGSGYPFSTYTTKEYPETGLYYPVVSRRLVWSLPYYRRIDIGLSYTVSFSNRYKMKVTFEIFNIFDFKNILSYKTYVMQDGYTQRIRNNLSRRLFNFRMNFCF